MDGRATPTAQGARQRPLLADRAFDVIESLIVTGQLPADSFINERELCEQIKIGRTPVREALQRLRSDDYVRVEPGVGVWVSPADPIRQLDLLAVRRPLEELTVTSAATRANSTQRRAMTELVDHHGELLAGQTLDPAAVVEVHRRMQHVMREAADNPTLGRVMRSLHSQSRRLWYPALVERSKLGDVVALHASALRAVAQGDADEARAAAQAGIDFLQSITEETLRLR